ncbi:MAG: right-handed parallel beta-helix repeat-containing protein [Flavobacteriales bacterium]|nr:right-handed parallel beta-helix repeat-containing protein [Flavobacteriales bacterium]
MKKILHVLAISIFLVLTGFLNTQTASAQIVDTLLFDYDDYFSCDACGDDIMYNVGGTNDSFVDPSNSSVTVFKMDVKLKLFTCYTGNLIMFLNGTPVDTAFISSMCSCNACDSLLFHVSELQMLSYYKRNGKNKIEIKRIGGTGLYIDRSYVYLTKKSNLDYDAAVIGIDTPSVIACKGSQRLVVRVSNFGLKPFTGLDIDWKWNGTTQSTVSFSGTLDTLNGSNNHDTGVYLGSKSVTVGKTDTLVVWTSSPGGQVDSFTSNDTAVFYIRGGLSDTLTVGGSSPDFGTIQDALDAIMVYGVCGPTYISIRPGKYSEKLHLYGIPGSNQANRITFFSENGDSSSVIVESLGTSSSDNQTLLLENTGNLIFRQITFEALGSSYSTTVQLKANVENIQFDRCHFIGYYGTLTGSAASNIYRTYYSSSDMLKNVEFNQCNIANGSYGIFCTSPNNPNLDGFMVNNCILHDQYYMNLRCQSGRNVVISNCNFDRNPSSYTSGYGVYLYNISDSLRILNNRIFQKNGNYYGLYMGSCYGISGNRHLVANNFISCSTSNTSRNCYYADYCNYVDLVHNNFFQSTPYSLANVAQINEGVNNRVLNNNFFNNDGGRAFLFASSNQNSIERSDRNNFFNKGNDIGTFYGKSITEIPDLWPLGSDTNSVSVNPGHPGTYDLHVYHVDLDGRAESFPPIDTDIDGEARNSSGPDIGADEFRLVGVDAGIQSFEKVIADTQCLNVVVKNFGAVTLTSVSINWMLNGVTKTTRNWTGSLPKGDTAVVCLGTLIFSSDTLYHLKTWTSSPNSSTDSIPQNDTLDTQFFPAMSGIYTIGGTNPDFSTFDSAVMALNRGGIKDSVLFKVRNGTYTEQFEIGNIGAHHKKNAVVFESESKDSSKVIVQFASTNSSNNYVVYLNGSVGVSFRHMTFKNTGSSYQRVIYISNYSRSICFENNRFENNDSTNSTSNRPLVYIYYNRGEDLVFRHNYFNRGSYGILYSGDYNSRDFNVNIEGNRFRNQGYVSIYGDEFEQFQITRNEIMVLNDYVNYGLYLSDIYGASNISNNRIIVSGMSVSYGMYLDYFYSSSDTLRIFNNFISIDGEYYASGIYGYYLYPANIYHNNVYNNSNYDPNYGSALETYYGVLRIHNNNLFHTRNLSFYYYYPDHLISNFNNLWSGGPNIGYFNNNFYTSLSNFSAAQNKDTNSVSVDPLFTSEYDLHTSSIQINGKGKPLNSVPFDIDGEARDTLKPDIGADEFSPLARDMGILKFISPPQRFYADTTEIEVVAINYGLDTVKSFTAQAMFNTDTLPRVVVNKTLASGDTAVINLGKYVFVKDSVYNFFAWTSLPNGSSDQKAANDTAVSLNRRSAMYGVYTIGGTAPDFPTFTDAIGALKVAGIIDSVRFRVRNGTYNEQLVIPEIEGAGMRNSIVFESETKDSSKVTLQFNSTRSDSNFVVLFEGADGITFRLMKVHSLSSSYAIVFKLKNDAQYITLYKNNIVGPNTSGSSTTRSLLHIDEGLNNYLSVDGNQFNEGDYSVYFYGYNPNPPYDYCVGTEIINNKFQKANYAAIYCEYGDSVRIHNNYVFMYEYPYAYPFYLYYLQNFQITNNQLYIPSANIGIYTYYCGDNSFNNLIANNMLYITNSLTNIYGFYMYGLGNTDIIHNTVKVDAGSNSSSYALYMNNGSDNNIYNNIFSNFNNGYAMYFDDNNLFDHCDNNDLYTNGSILTYLPSVNYPDLMSWNAGTGNDSNSISVDPVFRSMSNLHVKEVSLNAAARFFNSVPFDIDNEARDSLAPDIGADEFDLPPNDAGIVDILIPKTPFPADTQSVTVVLKNFGGNPLYAADIDWNFNGTSQSTYSWSDTLLAGDTMHVKLGVKVFMRDSSYSMKVWSSSPNGTADSIPGNDTATVLNQFPALSGIYTIGGASPDFLTFTDAIDAMKKGGIVDSVRFDVRNGSYSEQFVIPYIRGAMKENSIIFQSEQMDSSKVLLVGLNSSSKNYVVKMDSTSGVTFRYMSLKTNQINTYNRVFHIYRGCRNINIHHCNIRGKDYSYTGDAASLIYQDISSSSERAFENIKIDCNRFHGGAYGVNAYAYSNIGHGNNMRITRNNFENQYYMGLYLYYLNNFVVDSNTLYHSNTSYGNGFGLYGYYCTGGFQLTQNNFYNQEYYGVYLYNCDGTTNDTSLVANNFIHVRSASSVLGLYAGSCDYINVFHNNIHVNNGNTSSYASQFSSNYSMACYNNNFVNSGSGYAISFGGTLPRSDNNNLYSNGTYLGYYSTARTNLSTWRSATGKDANSISVDPDYISNTDLHVRNIDLNGSARNLRYLVMYDFDGEMRDSLSDIGADEFKIPAADDAGISRYHSPVSPFKAGITPVKVYIKNYGSDTLKSATIHWRVNGNTQTNKSWVGKLAPGLDDTVTVGNFNFPSGKQHELEFWTSLPNGKTDSTSYNDSLIKKDIYPALSGMYTVGGSLPDYPTIADAVKALSLGGVIDTVRFMIRSGTYAVTQEIGPYPGGGPNRPVYIESQNGDSSSVTFISTGYNHIFYIKGADYLKFKKISFKPGYYYGVRYDNGSNNLGFENCYFNLGTYYYSYGIYSSSDQDDSLRVSNCRFDNGSLGIYAYSSSSLVEKGMIVENCTFNNQRSYCIYTDYNREFRIVRNTFSNSVGAYCVYLDDGQGGFTVSHNKFNFSNTSGKAVYIRDYSGSSGSRGNIFNNFISMNGSDGNSEAIHFYNCTYINFFHNSINVYGSSTSTYAFKAQYGNNYDLRNNIYCNIGGGFAVAYLNGASVVKSDYNDIYTTGTYIGQYNSTDYSNLSAWKSATSQDANSLSLNPAFTSNTDLHSNLISLDSACLPLSLVSDDIDLEMRNTVRADIGADEFQSLTDNLGISKIITPSNSCSLDSSLVKVTVFNYGNMPQVNFPVRYRHNGGSILSTTVSDTLKPGKSVDLTFTGKILLGLNTPENITVWTDLSTEKYRLNDTLKQNFTNYQKPDTVRNMVPADSTINVDFPISLSWLPSIGATVYDLYLWKSTESKPGSPNVSSITQISYQFNNGLEYGATYLWQIIAKNPVCQTPGLIKQFTLRHLPDLTVEEVHSPNSAFSANTISISWKIKNTGSGPTSGSWYDAVYLSADAVLDVTDQYLGATPNISALSSGQSYSNSMNVTLPNGISGNYYIFVKTDNYRGMLEADENNNFARDTGKMFVTLTPPPNLIVSSVVRPSNVFSGSPASIFYTVKNKGTGATRSGTWRDRIYLSKDNVVNGSATILATVIHIGNLAKDSVYTYSGTVNIPPYISGKYMYLVYTDFQNNEYEYASEGDNVTASDTINVILTPPPDLIVKDLTATDTASNRETINVQYNVINDGGTTTGNGSYSSLFLCPTSTFNVGISQFLANVYHAPIDTKDTSKVSVNIKIPNGFNGNYYLFAVADYYNYVNEVTNETNNVSSGLKINVISPDLVISRVSVASVDSTGSKTNVQFVAANEGKGTKFSPTLSEDETYMVFISKSSTWDMSKSTSIGQIRNHQTILPGDSIIKDLVVTIPDSCSGQRYFYVYADQNNVIYEYDKENNNTGRSNLMNVITSPYPDLIPSFFSIPDSSAAGNVIGLNYHVINKGDKTALPTWKDRFYLSRDSVFNPAKLLTLGTTTRSSDLEVDSSYGGNVYFLLPNDLVRGNYFYYLHTDYEKKVFEVDDTNIVRSKKVFIDGYPAVDLSVNCPSIMDTMMSGSSYLLNYSVTNIGEAKTAVNSWNDGVHLLNGIIWDIDTLTAPPLKTIFINKALDKDSTYTISQFVTIPNGYSGPYYLVVANDITNKVMDVDTSNDYKYVCDQYGQPKKLEIKLTPPPDLQITSWDVPTTATSGQPFKAKWKVDNKGTGATRSGAWKDQFYLSTDYTIGSGDILLGEKTHVGNLNVSGSYNDSLNLIIPNSQVGNFIVLIRTDGANVEYEHTNEGNNVVSAIITASKAPPADLIVTTVTAPDSVISGKTINVAWDVKNQGSNPASGSLRDNIYLSVDARQDANDVLLGTVQYSINLAPNATISRNMNVNVSGVPLGDYNVLVTTDVLNNINESIDTNNSNISGNLLNVTVPILPIDVKTNDTLDDNEQIYHRIIIPNNLAGESMLITLKGDSINGDNQIYVKYEDIVTGSNFDYKFREPFMGNQEIIIPELMEGTYYLLTTGKTYVGNKQDITLLARILPFEIRKVTPGSGGNTGEVTVLIEGSKLDSGTLFTLERLGSPPFANLGDTSLNYNYRQTVPERTVLLDPTKVYVTFNLTGYDTGFYDIKGIKPNETTVLKNGFKVVPGDGGDLNVTIARPGNQRTNNVSSMQVLFTNDGNVDIVDHKIIITSNTGAPIALDPNDLSKNQTSVEITVQENGGPPGRLRPQGNGAVDIYTKASNALGFTILK